MSTVRVQSYAERLPAIVCEPQAAVLGLWETTGHGAHHSLLTTLAIAQHVDQAHRLFATSHAPTDAPPRGAISYVSVGRCSSSTSHVGGTSGNSTWLHRHRLIVAALQDSPCKPIWPLATTSASILSSMRASLGEDNDAKIDANASSNSFLSNNGSLMSLVFSIVVSLWQGGIDAAV